jgi:hypothetical protein
MTAFLGTTPGELRAPVDGPCGARWRPILRMLGAVARGPAAAPPCACKEHANESAIPPPRAERRRHSAAAPAESGVRLQPPSGGVGPWPGLSADAVGMTPTRALLR